MLIDNIIFLIKGVPLAVLIPYAIVFIVLLIGSYTDLKTREVPDWVNLGLVGAGFGINLLLSTVYWKADYIIASIAGFGIFLAIALLMYYTGQWGGGDSKILMGMGAMIGIDFFSKNYFLLSFLFNAAIIGALYGIFWSLFLIIINRKKFISSYKKFVSGNKVKKWSRSAIIFSIALIFISFLFEDMVTKMVILYLALMSVATFYLWTMIKSVEESCMLKYVLPSQLTEGDWIAKDIKVSGKYITGPKDLGIEKKQIKKLVEFYKKGKIKKVLIKEGVPFVPSFLIAYIITLIFGNLVFLIV